jgi:hypothetical protein
MPSKVIKPANSLIYISGKILAFIKSSDRSVDEIHKHINQIHPHKISIEKLFLCLDFLFITERIESENEVIKTKR